MCVPSLTGPGSLIWTVPELTLYGPWKTTTPSRRRVSDELTSKPETVTLTFNDGLRTLVVGGLLPPVCEAGSRVGATGVGGCDVSYVTGVPDAGSALTLPAWSTCCAV